MPRIRLSSVGLSISLLVALLATQRLVAADAIALEFYPFGVYPTIACPNGGTTTVTGSQIGLMRYLDLRFVNNGTNPAEIGVVTISDVVGCVVPWNPRAKTFAVNGGGNSFDAEVGVRPTAALWSFRVNFHAVGDSTIDYSHTFRESGIATGSGPQIEVSHTFPSTVRHAQSGSDFDITSTPIGEPYDLEFRTTSRSALQGITITAPGWTGVNPNLILEVENQLPASLNLDQPWISTFRITALTTTQISTGFQCLNNDETIQLYLLTKGVAKPKLSIFNGTRQLSCNYSNNYVTGSSIGVPSIVTLTIRNNDNANISYAVGFDATKTVACAPSTTTAPTTTLAAGAETTWIVSVTPSASEWEFSPYVNIYSIGYSRSWRFRNTPVTPAGPGPGGGGGSSAPSSSESGSCGMGSGAATLTLLTMCTLGRVLMFRRRRGGGRPIKDTRKT